MTDEKMTDEKMTDEKKQIKKYNVGDIVTLKLFENICLVTQESRPGEYWNYYTKVMYKDSHHVLHEECFRNECFIETDR